MSTRALSSEQVGQCKKVFDLFDRDHDGRISVEEIQQVLHSSGKDITIENITQMMKEVDIDGNGTLDFDEFKVMMAKQLNTFESYYEIFKAFDQNKDGYVDAHDLQLTMSNIGELMSYDEAVQMIQHTNCKREGYVDYEEFLVILEKEGYVDEAEIDFSMGSTGGSEANKPLETVTVDNCSIS